MPDKNTKQTKEEKTDKLRLLINPSLKDKANEMAKSKGMNLSEYICQLLRDATKDID